MDKKGLRHLAGMRRHSLPALLKAQYDENIRSQLLKLIPAAERIGIYISVDDEADTRKIIENLLQQQKEVFVPKCTMKQQRPSLDFYRILSLEECLPSRYGLLEPIPQPSRLCDLKELELMIVPVVGFDSRKNRIGHGRGYYDAILQQCRCTRIGLAYTLQQVEDFDPEPHDVALDMVITEQGAF